MRSDAGAAVELFDSIVSAERRGDPLACQILDVLDRRVEVKSDLANDELLVIVARDEGWFERDMPYGLWSVG